jgi:serine/threonine-protein kinase
MDTALSPPVGQLLGGRYQVGSRIARGGMATVYLATDTRLDRVVALKIAHPELSDDADFVRRFIGEAHSAARLSSPNVVAIYDQGSQGRLHYIAMEYVAGRTLRDLLDERGRLRPGEALDIMTGVLTGLAAAHQAGFAHRDVKPENVLLATNGEIKVADFGLARSVAGAAATKGGMLIGTAAYLAPEQVVGGTSDARTDVYAAGIMLFELLTGVQPHVGESPLAVAHKHVDEVVPPPSSVLAGLSPALDALVAMATSRDPDLRPADAAQFLRAIDEVRSGLGVERAGAHRAPVRYEELPDSAPYATTGGMSALPSLAPHGYPTPSPPPPGPGGPSSVNHTLVVPGGAAFDHPGSRGGPGGPVGPGAGYGYSDDPGFGAAPGYGDGSGEYDRYYRTPPAPAEPWLQRMLFGRRFWYLLGGVAAIAIVALGAWWLSSGRYTKLPPMRGLAASAARSDLTKLGFSVHMGKAKYAALPKGEVLLTTPAAGTRVTGGSPVTLVLSLGPRMIQMPNVTGDTLRQAKLALRTAHLHLGAISKTLSGTVPAGDVISSNPQAYTTWPQTRPVGLTISEGPGLPDFIGQPFQFAQTAAQAGGYRVQQVLDKNSKAPAGQITRQSPLPNTPIKPGEVVIVHVSQGPPTIAVPDVKGLTVQQAVAELQQAGFSVKVNEEGFGDKVGSYSPTSPEPKGTTITVNAGIFSFF